MNRMESRTSVEIDPAFSEWLQEHGFSREPEGVAYKKQVEYEGKPVQLQVDFSKNRWGARYGYVMVEESDPPEWKNEKSLREHPELMKYKDFRDKIAASESKVDDKIPESKVPEKELPIKMPKSATLNQQDGQAVMLELEAKDDTQLLAEMRGDLQAECLKELFYSFQSGNRTVTGLSYAGVRAVARRQGHIEIKDIIIEEKQKSWLVKCKGVDKARDFQIYGVSMQPKNIRFRSGDTATDEFALIKAVAKAQRNALRCLIPERIVARMYSEWQKLQNGNLKEDNR